MSFMISRETENVQSLSEVMSSFKAITANGDRAYVTKDELKQVAHSVTCVLKHKSHPCKFENFVHNYYSFTTHPLSPSPPQALSKEQAQYCIKRMKPYNPQSGDSIRGALDYREFAQSLFA